MILVVGATGQIGRELVNLLASTSAPVRALVRAPAKAHELQQEGIDVVIGDLGQPETLALALRGVEKAFLVSSHGPQQVALQGNFVRAAAQVHLRHLVKLSVPGAAPDAQNAFARWHGQTDQQIERSGIPFTLLQPVLFMQNLLMQRASISTQGAVYQPIARAASVGLIDVRDIAAAAARVLSGPGHEGQRYVLTGPAALTFDEICAQLSTALNKPIRYSELTPEEFKRKMLPQGQTEWFLDAFIELSAAINQNKLSQITTTVADVTGKPPRSFAQFASDYAEQFAGPVPTGV